MLANVFARSPDEKMLKQWRQGAFVVLDQFEIFAQRARLNAEVNPVIRVEKANLVENVPCPAVSRGRGQQNYRQPQAVKELVEPVVAQGIAVAEVVRFIQQHD